MPGKSTSNLLPRPPIVVVVGHVNHGKTSLLDYLRKTNVVAKEAGSITQSVGAYEVLHNGKKVTFIDTPGHEAFSRMRVRGASVADLAILVVAADEGVKPQTVEAIRTLRDAKTPYVVAITKIDKSNANVDKVKNELLAQEVFLEGYGGDVSWQPISAVSGQGINELLDLVVLAGEVLGLRYNPRAPATGYVLESLKGSQRGIVAHLVLKNGTLREGEKIATRSAAGKVRILENFLGKRAKELVPSAPAVAVGFESLPEAGEEFTAGPAAEVSVRPVTAVPAVAVGGSEVTAEGETKVKVMLKADTSGSLEALRGILSDRFQVVDAAVGDITDGNVKDAITAASLIVGFGVKVERAAEKLAQAQHVEIVVSDIIYRLIEELDARLKAREVKVPVAELEILKVFETAGRRQIVGGRVTLGVWKSNLTAEVERAGNVLGEGRILNVQINRQDVHEAAVGTECGLLLESDIPIKIGDKLRLF